jgi:hypothetical protein
MFSDPVTLRGYLCPHLSFTVHTREEWGAAHTYTMRGHCDICGPVSHTERRHPYQG